MKEKLEGLTPSDFQNKIKIKLTLKCIYYIIISDNNKWFRHK